jgi:catechol 2,3-dioxygenase-like lactoylglutathione lyase family enzyme
MSKIVLWVSDLDAQVDFYTRLFDVAHAYRDAAFAEIADGTNSVLLHRLPAKYAATAPLTAQLSVQDEVAIKPVFTVANIQDAHARTADTFATFADKTATHGEFTYRDVVDPEGNVIQLQQRN